MTEDFDNHRRIIDGSDNLLGTAAVGTLFHVDVEETFVRFPRLCHEMSLLQSGLRQTLALPICSATV